MLEQLIFEKSHLRRHLDAPLLEERERYLQYIQTNVNSNKDYLLRLAVHMLRGVELLKLSDNDSSLVSVNAIRKIVEEWGQTGISRSKQTAFSSQSKGKMEASITKWLSYINRLESRLEDSIPVFNTLFRRRYTRKKMLMAPFLEERIEYLLHWEKLGATRNTLKTIAEYELHIIKYLSMERLRVVNIDEIGEASKVWAKEKNVTRRTIEYSPHGERVFFRYAKGWLGFMECLDNKKDTFPFEKMAIEYLDYLVNVRGYSLQTYKSRYLVLKRAFLLLGKQCNVLHEVTPKHIDTIITCLHEEGKMSRRSIAGLTSILRSFFLYAEQKKWCMENISSSIYSPRVYSEENIPYAPQRDNIKQAVQYYNTDEKSAIRNYAILQIFAVYGIRTCELANLQLKDLDWRKELLHLRRAKGCRPQTFPLVRSVGDAILHYLKEIRQNESHSEYVFLCMDAPYRPVSTSAVYKIVSDSLRQQDIVLKHYGAHCLRHGSATLLVNSGFTMKEVSDYLGHQSLDTTRIYAKVDLLSLRKVADMNWEGLL
ncbi:hypothetical protein D7V92_21605 [Parabacteroides sp. CH2-D42-20]|uniref:tyrosine-type recombinase/integrase n=1 Tax=Parabacteroides sp. CH2-D42-20 TaxID=2320086 RepID=UPI000EF758BE|nr:tyrosine-type recombinase/integrase [Parabacteroides sp. CH2-D42-20]RLT67462.1 hypothetical protein D7V92_21605 [Parabacteroides sp. CH2-D42-20]